MADTTPKPKVGKKLPKWAIPVGGAAAVALIFLLMKSKKAASETPTANATGAEGEGLTNQSFIPVTGSEGGAGAGGYGYTANGESSAASNTETTTLLSELLKSNQESSIKQQENNQKFTESVIANLGTGGGAPSTTAAGTTTVQAPTTQPSSSSPAPSAPAAASKSVAVVMHVVKCGNGCEGHEYPKGKDGKSAKVTECQTKNSKHQCVWS